MSFWAGNRQPDLATLAEAEPTFKAFFIILERCVIEDSRCSCRPIIIFIEVS